MTYRNAPRGLLGVTGLLALAAAGGTFSRDVDEGTTVRRRFEFAQELELVETVIEVDGEALPEQPLGLEVTTETVRVIAVEDEYGPSDGERPRRLVRYFDTLSEELVRTETGVDGAGELTRSRGSDLEGRSVVFVNGALDDLEGAAGGESRVTWDGPAGDDELLEGLFEDMDLRSFLPEPGVEPAEGEEYSVEPRRFLELMWPGGVRLQAAEEDRTRIAAQAQLAESLDGDVTARFVGHRAGRAVLALELTITTGASQRLPTDSEADLFARVEYAFELEGELLWDSEAGHLSSLELTGTVEFEERLEMHVAGTERLQTMRFEGPVTVGVHVTAVD